MFSFTRQSKKERPSARDTGAQLTHVAIIMDGNRRWADNRGLPRLSGHQEGVKTLKNLVKHVAAAGLRYLTVYAFSSENWNRSNEEVDYLMKLFGKVVTDELDELAQNNVRLRFIGDIAGMPADLQKYFVQAIERTKDNKGLSLQVALNYGSRLELAQAMQSIAGDLQAGKIEISDIDEQLISSKLYTREIPDPDLIIRTGGEMRLSNYLLWQAAYSELYVTPLLWPDFTPEEYDKAVSEFGVRERRWGL